MSEVFRMTRRVEFCETDAAGIAHFSAFFWYMEQAEHALLRRLGTSVVVHDADSTISWPRVSAKCDYTAAALFEQELDICLVVERLGRSSVTYRCDFTHAGQPIAVGRMTAVYCRIFPGQKPQPMVIPEVVENQLRRFLAEPATED